MVSGHRVSEGSVSMNPYTLICQKASMSLWGAMWTKKRRGKSGRLSIINWDWEAWGKQRLSGLPHTLLKRPSMSLHSHTIAFFDKLPHLLNGWQWLPPGTLVWRPPSQWAPVFTRQTPLPHLGTTEPPLSYSSNAEKYTGSVWLSAVHNGLQREEGSQGEVERYVCSKVWH